MNTAKEFGIMLENLVREGKLEPNKFAGQSFILNVDVSHDIERRAYVLGHVEVDYNGKWNGFSSQLHFFQDNEERKVGYIFHPRKPISKLHQKPTKSYVFCIPADEWV